MNTFSTMAPQVRRWLIGLDDDEIAEQVGSATLRRGVQYARSGRVSSVKMAGPNRLYGQVRGSYQYVVLIDVDTAPARARWSTLWEGTCTCPVNYDCKHVVATLIEARHQVAGQRGGGEPTRSSWERALAPVLLEHPEPPEHSELGLQFSVEAATRYTPQPTVRLRPLIPAKRGGWRSTGVTWRDLASGSASRVLLQPQQARALNELRLRADSSSHLYLSHRDTIELSYFGVGFFDSVRAAQAAGVELVPAGGLTSVQVDSALLTLALTAEQSADGATVRLALEPVADVDTALHGREPVITGDCQVLLVGTPAWAVAVLRPEGKQHELRLFQLDEPISTDLVRLYQAGAMTVPFDDLPRFATDYLPRLAQLLPVTTIGDALRLPTVEGPWLRLTATAASPGTDTPTDRAATEAPDHGLSLQWSWRYLVDDKPFDLPLDEHGSVPGLPSRDRTVEADLVASVEQLFRAHLSGRFGVLRPTHLLQGMQTATFIAHLLELLRADERLIVEVLGDLPDYREVDVAPLITVSSTDSADPSRTDWFDLGISVSLDGEPVPFTPLFTALATGEEHLLLPSGAYFSLRRPELQHLRQLIEEARELQDHDGPGLQLSRLHTSLWEELVSLGVVGEQSSRWSQAVRSLGDLDQLPVAAVPPAVQARLRPYQAAGFTWLTTRWAIGLGGILADDMGLGKTVQTLAAVQYAAEQGWLTDDDRTAPVLVVAPTSVVGTWAEQAAQFVPGLRVATVEATGRRRGRSIADLAAAADIVVTSYTLLRIEGDQYREITWAAVILDEAQAVKNRQSKTYAEVRRLPARFRLAITGTPLENSLMDLWSLLSIVAPGLYPDPADFAETYRKPIEAGSAPELLDRLRRRLRPLMLRRRKQEVAPDLPPKVEQVLSVELSPAQRKVYSAHLQRERQRVLGMLDDVQKNRMAIFRALTKLRQLALAPELVEKDGPALGSAKLDVLLDHLTEVIAEGHRALVFSQFTGFLALLRDRLDRAGIGYSYLDGRTRDRAKRIDGFRTGDDPVFLISLKAGGFGLTLTEADYVFVLDPWWNPAAEEQAIDRTHRIGQQNTVMVYRLVSSETIEEKVVALQDRKRALFSDVVEGGEGGSTELTADDIRSLLDG